MFFGLLLIPLCLSLYVSWHEVLWCALVAAFSGTCAFLCTYIYIYIAQYCRRKELNRVPPPPMCQGLHHLWAGALRRNAPGKRPGTLQDRPADLVYPSDCYQTANKNPAQPGSRTRR